MKVIQKVKEAVDAADQVNGLQEEGWHQSKWNKLTKKNTINASNCIMPF